MRMRSLTLAGALVALSVMLPTVASPVGAMSIGATALTQAKDARAQQTQDTFVEARYLRRYPRMGGNWHGGHGNWNGYYGYHNHGYHNHGYYPYWGGGVVLGFPGMYGGYGGDYANDYGGDYGNSYSGGDHVSWCLQRYRSYNPSTNTYMGYDGYHHPCMGPY